MVFSSYLFLFYFLPAALLLYYLVPRRTKHLLLTLVSYLFYGWANPLFVFLLLFSTAVDYICGLVIAQRRLRDWKSPIEQLEPGTTRTPAQRRAVILSIVTNLSLLGFFKYFNFATDNFDAIAGWLGLPGLQIERAITVVLPLGISFYTFQSMSYTIDVYRGHARALRNFVDFACYVSMFPQLVAGPIIRFSEVADQLRERSHTVTKFARGVAFVSVGLAKKILIANPCGKVADVAFDAASIGATDAWFGVTAYAFQIYFDFSAYSDMAIGLGLMLGFVFSKNFDSPYRAQSITEFWRRWHISLSTWLRDYLYIPLGGNHRGAARTYVNLALVMLLGGLWHGAAWNFVVWGGMHGCLLAAERLRGKVSPYRWLPKAARQAMTFLLILISWVFFRAADLPSAMVYLRSMFGLEMVHESAGLLGGILYQPYYLGTVTLAAVVTWTCPQTWDWTRTLTPVKAVAIAALWLASIAVLATQAYNPFIYFIF
ncbi:MAG TPA: MBOAT family protein [Vicinamibacteria bacterium]